MKISGEYLTDKSRQLVEEGKYLNAVDLLSSSLEGIELQQVNSILSGKNKLQGLGELYLIEDSIKEPIWLEQQYGIYFKDIIMINKKYYKIYDKIKYLCKKDVDKVFNKYDFYSLPVNTGGNDNAYGFNVLRARSYLNKVEDQVLYSEKFNAWLLLEKIEVDYPEWLDEEEVEELLHIKMYKDYKIKREQIEYEKEVLNGLLKSQEDTNNYKSKRESSKENSVIESYLSDQDKAEDFFDKIEDYKLKIENQANEKGGWLTLKDQRLELSYKVPKNPFLRWCLINNEAYKSIDWSCISPRGVKTGMDDRNHTDWFLFTGLDLRQSYSYKKENNFFNKMRTKYVKELTNFNFAILSKGLKSNKFKGKVIHIENKDEISKVEESSIVVIPNASPDYEFISRTAVKKNSILVTEIGGAGSHLSIVSREFGFTLIQVEKAKNKFPNHSICEVDFNEGVIKILDRDIEEVNKEKRTGEIYN